MRQESELRPYQDRIATHLYQNDAALCVVRPGGGKTIAALTAIRELKRDGVIRQALVVAPKRVAENVWPDETKQWAHVSGMRYALLQGGPRERLGQLLKATRLDKEPYDLVIVGIDNVGWLLETIDRWPVNDPIFDLLVIDEISKLRNPTGVRAKLLAKNGRRWKMRWGLSGTLRPNGAENLFMPARVITQGALWGKSFYQWRQANFYATDFQGYNWAPLPGAEDRLNEEIAPWTVTLREDEYPQLPQLSVQLDYINLPDRAREAYRSMHKKLVAEDVVAANAAVATGKLAQIANGFIYREAMGIVVADEWHDEKREWLADVIEQATGPTLLIYEYKHDLDMMQELIPGLPWLGGDVTDATATFNIVNWNKGMFKFMALHPAAGGHGLNLQAGGCDMAWLAPCWSPEYWEQTIARLHRSGQSKPVIVRVCVARDTVDEMKLDRVHHKVTAQAAFEKYLQRQMIRE